MDPLPVLATREPYRNHFFRVVEEDVPDRLGRPYAYNTVACAWDVVVVIPLLSDGRLVIERIYRHPYRRTFLEFPAGGIESSEDPLAAAARELAEETGYHAGRLRPLQTFATLPGLLHMTTHLILAEDCVLTSATAHEAMEHIEVVTMDLDQAWAAARAEPLASAFLMQGLSALAVRQHEA